MNTETIAAQQRVLELMQGRITLAEGDLERFCQEGRWNQVRYLKSYIVDMQRSLEAHKVLFEQFNAKMDEARFRNV